MRSTIKHGLKVKKVCQEDGCDNKFSVSRRSTEKYCEKHRLQHNPKATKKVCAHPDCTNDFYGYNSMLYCEYHRNYRQMPLSNSQEHQEKPKQVRPPKLKPLNLPTTPKAIVKTKICAKEGCNKKFETTRYTKYCPKHRFRTPESGGTTGPILYSGV